MKPTIEATIEHIKEECNSDYAEMAIEALEKQTPKKPDGLIDITGGVVCYACPICGKILERGEGCSNNNCNQKIDWSEVK